MSKWKMLVVAVAVVAMVGAFTELARSAQPDSSGAAPGNANPGGGANPDNGGGRGGRNNGGGGGRGAGQNMSDWAKRMLAATDEEWKVIQPKLEKVTTLQAEMRGFGGMSGGGGWRNRGPGGGEGQPAPAQSEVSKATQELRDAVNDENPDKDVIKAKLEALRKARAKAKEELTKAQKELRELLSVKQEAQLVMIGMLD